MQGKLFATTFRAKAFLSLLLFLVFNIFLSCKKDDKEPIPDTPEVPSAAVNVDPASFPFQNLSEYHFYVGELKQMTPNARVIPYEPATPLFSDYAHKSRFIWMPEGVSATYVNDHLSLDFPDGTMLIKNFFYDHVLPNNTRKILETRLIYKRNGEWLFADYLWNDDQTEATFSLDGAYVPLQWNDDSGTTHSVEFRIPSEVECHTCHKVNQINAPIGLKPQNINFEYDYEDGLKNQLDKLVEVGYLNGNIPDNIESIVAWDDESQPIDLRVRSYLDANCAHCHSDEGHCYYRPLRFPFRETSDDDKLGVCVEPQEFLDETLTHVIARGNTLRSVMYYRLNTTDQQYRMPLFGRTVLHEEGIALIEEYISSLSPSCPE